MGRPKKEVKKTEDDTSVDDVLASMQKKYGDDISIVDEDPDISEVKAIPTGSFGLDSVFGCHGMPKGRMIELFGQESSGKSTLSQYLMAQVQKAGGKVALIDAEFSYDPRYTASIGVDTSKLLVTQPLHLEAAMETLKELVKTNVFDLIVVDSIAAMAPMSEVEGEFLHDTMGLQARKLGAALRVLTGPMSKSKTTVIFINQLREKIGIMFGKKETTPGGKALKFFSSVRLEVSKGEAIKDEKGKQIGNFVNVTGVKNKVGFPWVKTSLELYYGKGLSREGDVIDYGEKIGVIHKEGNTWKFGDGKLGVGREQAKAALEKNTELFDRISNAITEYEKQS